MLCFEPTEALFYHDQYVPHVEKGQLTKTPAPHYPVAQNPPINPLPSPQFQAIFRSSNPRI